MKKFITLLSLFSLLITGCTNQESIHITQKNPPKKVLKIGYLPITHSTNLMMTKKINNQQKKSPYKIKLIRFNNWPDLMDAVNSGRVDGVSTLIELAMKSKAKGSDIKAVALGHHEGNVVLGQKGTQITDYKNNKDYSFAIPHRYSTHFLLLEELRKQLKISNNKFHYHEMPPAEMPAALSEQRIDGYSVAEPFGSLGQKLGKGTVLKQGSQIIPDAYCCVLVLREDLINKHKDISQSFIKDYKVAGQKMTNKQKNVDVMSKNFKQDKKVLEQSAKWTSYGDLTLKEDGYKKITHLVNQHQLFNPPSYHSFVDSSLYKEV